MKRPLHRRKRCLSCQELFDPDPRTKGHQRYCSKAECQTIRQRHNEQDWRQRNPDCVAYQQEQSRKWYQTHPQYSSQRREDHPEIENKNRDDTRLRMREMRKNAMFDKSKSILTQLTGGYTDKCYLTRGFRWLMVRLTKASPLSKQGVLSDNRWQLRKVPNRLPEGRLYDASKVWSDQGAD